MITADDINRAFNDLEKAFDALAEAEEKRQGMEEDLAEYKEGSGKALAIKKRIADMGPKIRELQRDYRKAAMKADRVRLLVDIQKTANGG